MIQLKTFKKTDKIEVINEFLRSHEGCTIMSSNPYVVSYNIEDNLIKPSITLKGAPVDFTFHLYRENPDVGGYDAGPFDFDSEKEIHIISSLVSIFDDCIRFKTLDGTYEVARDGGYLQNVSKSEVPFSFKGNTEEDDDDLIVPIIKIGELTWQSDYVYLMDMEAYMFRTWNSTKTPMNKIIEFLKKSGFIHSDQQFLYNERTHALIEAANITAKATLKGSENISDGLISIAIAVDDSSKRISHETKNVGHAILGERMRGR